MMQTAQLAEIAKSFETLAHQLREAIGSKPPAYLSHITALLPDMPEEFEAIPPWLDQVNDEQFRASWVTAIVATLVEKIDNDEHFVLPTRAMLRVLIGVRDRYDAMMNRQPIVAVAPQERPLKKAEGRMSNTRYDWDELMQRARQAAPNPGDKFKVAALFPDAPRDLVIARLRASPDFDLVREPVPGKKGPGACFAYRRSDTAGNPSSEAQAHGGA